MKQNFNMNEQDKSANPAPLGLFGFGLTTILLNLHNAGFYELDSMVLSMGIFYGGLAQVVAGLLESKKNSTFGLTAFTSYGFFWISFAGIIIGPRMGWMEQASLNGLISYLIIWGIFSGLLFIGTFKISIALQLVFGSLTILFFLLALGNFSGNLILKKFAAYEGILCGSLAIYTGFGILLNEVYGKSILPLGIVVNK